MRWIGWITVLLLGTGWIATEVSVTGTPQPVLAQTDWRLTRDGWQRATWLGADVPAREPALHPGVVGLLQLLVSLLALAAFPALISSRGGSRLSPPAARHRPPAKRPFSRPRVSHLARRNPITPVAA